jgi:mannan endo-1,4-beta-mannosidase
MLFVQKILGQFNFGMLTFWAMKKIIFYFLVLTLSFKSFASTSLSSFVQVQNGRFVRHGAPYNFMGANYWQGMNLGSSDSSANRAQLIRELDHLKKWGIKNLRILALSEGPSSEPYRIIPAVQNKPDSINENILLGLDFLLHEMSKRDMTAVIMLSNFWPWSGGLAQRVNWHEGSPIPYPPPHPGGSWGVFQEYSSRFYTIPNAIDQQLESVRKIVTRVNTITKKPYSQDPTIMSWQLANEPRGGRYRREFLAWVKKSAKFIKSLDPNHLVSLGSEGDTLNPSSAGNNFLEDHGISEIDYTTIHIWVENWGIYNPKNVERTKNLATSIMRNYINDHVKKSQTLKKPIVLEEFGIARDKRSMDPSSSTLDRNYFYEATFKHVWQTLKNSGVIQGVNFWAYTGEARPRYPYGSLWKQGDQLLGDPPHEEQGWYGVYDSDKSTLEIIYKYSQLMNDSL